LQVLQWLKPVGSVAVLLLAHTVARQLFKVLVLVPMERAVQPKLGSDQMVEQHYAKANGYVPMAFAPTAAH
jgi:hypothetical protein